MKAPIVLWLKAYGYALYSAINSITTVSSQKLSCRARQTPSANIHMISVRIMTNMVTMGIVLLLMRPPAGNDFKITS